MQIPKADEVVILFNNLYRVLATTITDSDGKYIFKELTYNEEYQPFVKNTEYFKSDPVNITEDCEIDLYMDE